MEILTQVSMKSAHDHYLLRFDIHNRLLELLDTGPETSFARLALAIDNPRANYSAYDHGLGKRVLSRANAADAVISLAKELLALKRPGDVPQVILAHSIPFLKISVGSEIAMLLRPNDCWVANARSVWAYLLVKHAYNFTLANEELQLYHDGERSNEMNYEIWWELHRLLETSQTHLHDLAITEARRQRAATGEARFLWADAVANELYENRETIRYSSA